MAPTYSDSHYIPVEINWLGRLHLVIWGIRLLTQNALYQTKIGVNFIFEGNLELEVI